MFMQYRKNKRGWIRITEAVVAILIMASVLIVLYANKTPQVSFSSYVGDLQLRILGDVADNPTLRNEVLRSPEVVVNGPLFLFINNSIPLNFNFAIRVCNLSNNACLLGQSLEQEVFVEDRIISSNLTTYSPKMLRLFMWEKLR
jgi:hypothetical protein